MHRFPLVVLAALLASTGVAAGAGNTPPPGQTPGRTPGKTIGLGVTPGQTPGSGGHVDAHAPVCPDEAHIRLPQNTSPYPDQQIRTTVFGNCSDPDGDAATAALTYNSPNVLPQHVPFFLDEQGQDITHLTFVPEVGYTGPDFMQYYAIDADKHTTSNTTDFYIEVVAGLKHASAVWTGTNHPDTLSGTGLDDAIAGYGGDDDLTGAAGDDKLNGGPGADDLSGGAGDDTIVDTSSAGSARAVGTAAKAKPKKFVNTIDAGAGNDKINVRNHKRDNVKCGKGKDKVTADKNDKLSGCEKAKRKK
jgi:Ca2+-binding RTX toxin-like protein